VRKGAVVAATDTVGAGPGDRRRPGRRRTKPPSLASGCIPSAPPRRTLDASVVAILDRFGRDVEAPASFSRASSNPFGRPSRTRNSRVSRKTPTWFRPWIPGSRSIGKPIAAIDRVDAGPGETRGRLGAKAEALGRRLDKSRHPAAAVIVALVDDVEREAANP
jgi:hypothetical protein